MPPQLVHTTNCLVEKTRRTTTVSTCVLSVFENVEDTTHPRLCPIVSTRSPPPPPPPPKFVVFKTFCRVYFHARDVSRSVVNYSLFLTVSP